MRVRVRVRVRLGAAGARARKLGVLGAGVPSPNPNPSPNPSPSPHPRALGVLGVRAAELVHEARDDPVEVDAIVEAWLGMPWVVSAHVARVVARWWWRWVA